MNTPHPYGGNDAERNAVLTGSGSARTIRVLRLTFFEVTDDHADEAGNLPKHARETLSEISDMIRETYRQAVRDAAKLEHARAAHADYGRYLARRALLGLAVAS